jgi:hypothetical protein
LATLERLVAMFDWEFEWGALTRLATDAAVGATLGAGAGSLP